jgi:hypothetical protein
MGSTYPSSLSLNNNIRIKHVRSANWMAPTCPHGYFSFFWRGEPIGWHTHAPKACLLCFWRGGCLLDFPSSSQTVPIEFLLFPSISNQNSFVLIKFPNNSHQIPLVLINNPSNSFVPIKFPKSFHSHFCKVASGPTSKVHPVLIHLKLSCVARSVWPIDKSLSEDGCHFKCQGENLVIALDL